MHKCVFISKSNYVLMQEIRITAKKFGIEIIPCKYIFEMLENDFGDIDAILFESNNNLAEFQSIDFAKDKIFYFNDNKIERLVDDKCYNCLEEFLSSEIFKRTNNEKRFYQNDEIAITKKMIELGVRFNTWQSRFLKMLLIDMQNLGIEKSNREFIESEAIKYGVVRKNIYNSLRPPLKQIASELYKKKCSLISNRISQIIDALYLYIVKEIG